MRRVGSKNIASHYQGQKGEEYAKGRQQDELNHLGYQLQKSFYLPFLNKDMRVLDFGCGNGSLTIALKPHVALIEGLEVNSFPRNLAISQGIEVYEGIDSLPEAEAYDAIISNHVLEHIPDVIGTLTELRKYLKPNGVFITVLPIEDFRERRNRHWDPEEPNHHLHTWTPLLFGNALHEAGFSPRHLKVITHAWTPKLFFLGNTWIQAVACRLLSALKKRRQLLAVGINSQQ